MQIGKGGSKGEACMRVLPQNIIYVYAHTIHITNYTYKQKVTTAHETY